MDFHTRTNFSQTQMINCGFTFTWTCTIVDVHSSSGKMGFFQLFLHENPNQKNYVCLQAMENQIIKVIFSKQHLYAFDAKIWLSRVSEMVQQKQAVETGAE